MKCIPIYFLLLAVLYGCASSTDLVQTRQDISTVYGEQAAFRDKTNARLSKIERDMKDIQNSIGTVETGVRKQVADLAVGEETRDDRIRGILGRLDELEAQMRTYWDEMRKEIRELKKNRDSGAAISQAPPRLNPQESYKQGFDAYQKGAFDDAIQLFSQFLKQNPEDALAPNALFWMGESFMNLKEYEKAIVQYQELLDKFPKSDKTSRTMLRQGEAFAALGDKKSSTTLMKQIVELFPKSEEARVAQRRLRGGSL
jgi:tol-pal system protein YbgF